MAQEIESQHSVKESETFILFTTFGPSNLGFGPSNADLRNISDVITCGVNPTMAVAVDDSAAIAAD